MLSCMIFMYFPAIYALNSDNFEVGKYFPAFVDKEQLGMSLAPGLMTNATVCRLKTDINYPK